ncbi:hypothetical protein C1H76_8991 [Elsinoe australis]|uniref:Altered inheritance of mitochondria protein 19 n=1 Tax=Elsinoe australis TaxID=40998 RepID=A0A4U7AM50_9PEZI|nr:hypothetical protein C1H76_8991 [Elsinoe australis]
MSTPPSASPLALLKTAGESSLPPALLATLTTALHFRPFQPLPMLFPPVFLFSSYLNLSGFKIDSAGISAAWSAAYLILAARRRPMQGLRGKFTARGAVRGVAMAGAAGETVAGGTAYALGRREREERKRNGAD